MKNENKTNGKFHHLFWIRMRTLPSHVFVILLTVLPLEFCDEIINLTIKSIGKKREKLERQRLNPSLETLRNHLDFSVATIASNDLFNSKNQNLYLSAQRLQNGTEIINNKLHGRRVRKHSCHCLTTHAYAKY